MPESLVIGRWKGQLGFANHPLKGNFGRFAVKLKRFTRLYTHICAYFTIVSFLPGHDANAKALSLSFHYHNAAGLIIHSLNVSFAKEPQASIHSVKAKFSIG